jgi:hypothetical protein
MAVTHVSMVVAAVVLATSGATIAPQAAAGLEPGVHVDPGSPAAKEYALPLNQARQTEGGSSSGSSETSFGAGIKPPGSGGAGGSGSASHDGGSPGRSPSRSSGRGPSESRSHGVVGTAPSLPPAVQRAVESPDSSGGGGSLPALIGGGVAILVLGAFGGTVLRHSRRPTPSS